MSNRIHRSDQVNRIKSKPRIRKDGELYERPVPNPFTPEWMEGYYDGLDGQAFVGEGPNYRDGYYTGLQAAEEEREELDRFGSSNT